MARKHYAKRYAQAAFEIALEKNELDRWQSDIKKVAALSQDAKLVALLQNPRLAFDIKSSLLSEYLGDVNPVALNLVKLLIARGSLGMVGAIADEYQKLLYRYRGIEQASVTTAVPLAEGEEREMAERLSNLTGKKVMLKSGVDPSIVGGIVVRMGGKLLDGSTRGKLLALKRELAGKPG